jgi:hypothetical protein
MGSRCYRGAAADPPGIRIGENAEMRPTAELSSITTVLEEVGRRVAGIADDYQAAKRGDLAADLYEVERAIASATRRLNRITASAARG